MTTKLEQVKTENDDIAKCAICGDEVVSPMFVMVYAKRDESQDRYICMDCVQNISDEIDAASD